jgi:hypothetical protein
MKRPVKPILVVGAALALGVASGLAYASWSVPVSDMSITVEAVSMPSGPTPVATADGAQAIVSWDAQQLTSGVKMTAYVVTAHDTEQPAKANVVRTVTASGRSTESASFTAAELVGGKWKWAITPRFQTWTGAEGKLSNPKLVFPAAAPTAGLAAAADSVVATGSVPATASSSAAVPPAHASATTSQPPATTDEPPKGEVTNPAPEKVEKTVEPEKTEVPKADPTLSEGPSGSDSPPAS